MPCQDYLKVITVIYVHRQKTISIDLLIYQLAWLEILIAKRPASVRIDCFQVNPVALCPIEADNSIAAIGRAITYRVEIERICSGSACERVPAASTRQNVIAGTAIKPIISASTIEGVVTGSAA